MTDSQTPTHSSTMPQPVDGTSRRQILQRAGAVLGALAMPAIVRAQSAPKIRVGYWPIAAGLPFYAAVELGYFKEAGLNVEVVRFAGAQQIMEGMLADRVDGSANGTGSANLAVGEIAAPGTFKIFVPIRVMSKTCLTRSSSRPGAVLKPSLT